MHVGHTLIFQNLDGHRSDREAFAFELSLAARAEASGFDSLWSPEHHFTDYQLTPNVPAVLSWAAGQTDHLRIGTIVTILPWHDPVRVAETFSVLDHLSEGRAILGIGRGLGRVEFEGFRVEMAESRRRFTEYTEAVVTGLDTGVMEYEGEFYHQPRVEIRPRPLSSFRGRTFASAISPESMELMARLGIGVMIVPQKPWDAVEADLEKYRETYLAINESPPPKPVLLNFVAVHEDAAEAKRHRDLYIERYGRSTVEHYEFDNVAFASIEGYEYYAGLAEKIHTYGVQRFNSFLADLQVWGTPEQVTERLIEHVRRTGAGALTVVLSYGGMPPEVAQANHDLFVREVLPHLADYDVGGDIGVLQPEPSALV